MIINTDNGSFQLNQSSGGTQHSETGAETTPTNAQPASGWRVEPQQTSPATAEGNG